MIRLRIGLGAMLGFCFTTLGLFGAGTTQASIWMVNNSSLTSGTKLLKASLPSSATLNTKIGGNEVKFTCKKGELKEGELEKEGKLKEGGSLRFTECTTAINGTTQKACEPNNGTEKGVIVSNKGKGRLTEHSTGEGVTILESTVKEKIEGKEVPVFGHVKMSEECSIGEDVPIIGPKIGVVDSSGMGEPAPGSKEGLLHEQANHKIKEGPLTEIWAISETAEHKATLTGEAKLELASGETWSGLSGSPAPIHIESCMGEGTECKPSSVGTTFTATGENFVIESGEEEHEGEAKIDKCNVTESGKVVDAASEGPGDKAEVSVTKTEFSKCTGPALTAVGLPWTVSADAATFAANREFEWTSYLLETFLKCKYVTSAPEDLMFKKWDTTPPNLLDLGHLVYEEGPFYCFKLRSLSVTLKVTSVSDPNLSAASSLIVK